MLKQKSMGINKLNNGVETPRLDTEAMMDAELAEIGEFVNIDIPETKINDENLGQLNNSMAPGQNEESSQNEVNETQFEEEIESSDSSDASYVSFVDEPYYEKYCNEIELTKKIDMGMVVDLMKNQQLFSQILPYVETDEDKKHMMNASFLQAIKGDYTEGGWWMKFLNFIRTKEDDKIWKTLKGISREKAMYMYNYSVKETMDKFTIDEMVKIMKEDESNFSKLPKVKEIKTLLSYLDHFLIIQREHRHIEKSLMTESLPSITKSVIFDDFDSQAQLLKGI